MHIKFHRLENIKLLSYHYYTSQVSNNDLLELNGFRIRNILSLAFNIRIKDIILENIFSINGTFLSSETKDNLFRYLSSDERIDLKINLSNYLDYQIDSDWLKSIMHVLKQESINTIIIPTLVLNNDAILKELNSLFPNKDFIDWHSYNDSRIALILDYNHTWKKRNIFTYNSTKNSALFLHHFFENVYYWKVYNDERHLFNRFNSKTRELIFGKELLNEIKDKLAKLRPQNTLNEWDVLHENNHRNSFNPQDEIVIYYSNSNSNKYKLSSSFLLMKDGKYRIEQAKELITNSELFEGNFSFSNLENIIYQLDLIEINRAIEKDNIINQIIQPLWSKFNLKETDGRLWKQLLKQKVKDSGVGKIFSDIENLSGIRQFISLNTFEKAYCNPDNNTIIPREKKVFKAICQYLDLPLEYRAAIHRERNLIGGHSQELHSKLKEIIYAIVVNGILDKHKNDEDLLEALNQKVGLIEYKIDMEFFGFTEDSLIYACIAICYEIIDKMKMKPIIKIEQDIHS